MRNSLESGGMDEKMDEVAPYYVLLPTGEIIPQDFPPLFGYEERGNLFVPAFDFAPPSPATEMSENYPILRICDGTWQQANWSNSSILEAESSNSFNVQNELIRRGLFDILECFTTETPEDVNLIPLAASTPNGIPQHQSQLEQHIEIPDFDDDTDDDTDDDVSFLNQNLYEKSEF